MDPNIQRLLIMTPSCTRPLRIASVASFLIAFPLCIAHGVLSHSTAPAVGLVPLGTSASAALWFLLRRPRRSDNEAAGESADSSGDQTTEHIAESRRPILVFFVDTIHAVALMVVLVFTWIHIRRKGNAALSAFYTGFAIRDLMQYLAWQTVPPDCPNCSHRLRPASRPSIPWFQSQGSGNPRNWKLKMPSMPTVKTPEWKVPAWLPGRSRDADASLFANEEDRYRDYPEDGERSEVTSPEPVDIVRKDRKNRSTPLLD
ncbi:hypothetical protein N7510_010330 [Penicillium lagena]|uniref:uncharacterized protein n=1 Tax=Penicillium lagena TaxID=94218 RepID=UPI00254009A6|nr:uncharacterized protein N7510_010330 [Penicillium lagena]KAJ5605176.1 hypothetical protein N7510_010330 [Penicillium lagena]